MKDRSQVHLPASRWLAYSAASVATACVLGKRPAAEAAIHYSGRVDANLPANRNAHVTFQLDQPGDSILFERVDDALERVSFAGFKAVGKESGAFSGFSDVTYRFIYRLNPGELVGRRGFAHGNDFLSGFGTLVNLGASGYFAGRGVGIIGFRFNSGAGKQFGWARVFMRVFRKSDSFAVLDYAYADPGEKIRAGQTSEDAPLRPAEESLGALAFGAAGLIAWRKRRAVAAVD
jgi:hypothetical protein